VGLPEFSDHGADIALLGVDEIVKMAHIGSRYFAAEFGERGAQCRKFF
jgi:hypothetical protein